MYIYMYMYFTHAGQEAHRKPVTVSERSQLLADKPGTPSTCTCCTGTLNVAVSDRKQSSELHKLVSLSGSVFSLLSAEDREKLKRVSGVVQTPQPLVSPATSQNVSPALAQVTKRPHPLAKPPFSRAAGAPIGLQAPPPALQKPSPLGDTAIESESIYTNPEREREGGGGGRGERLGFHLHSCLCHFRFHVRVYT